MLMGCQKTLKTPSNGLPLLLIKVWHQNQVNVRRMKQVCMPKVAVCWLVFGQMKQVWHQKQVVVEKVGKGVYARSCCVLIVGLMPDMHGHK